VGITQLPTPGTQQPPDRSAAMLGGGAYGALFLLGLAEGVVGSFHYTWLELGPVPLGALVFCALILVTCALGGRAMGSMGGALLPAIGWFIASFGLAMPNSGGSVIITNTAAGEWYLYAGALCVLVGVLASFAIYVRPARA
jgi:hypothetical protein